MSKELQFRGNEVRHSPTRRRLMLGDPYIQCALSVEGNMPEDKIALAYLTQHYNTTQLDTSTSHDG